MKNLAKTLCAAALLASGSLLAIAEPYASINEVDYEPYFLENSWILLNKVNSLEATIFIDVESPEGEAARAIASNTSEDVKVYCINPWEQNEYQFQTFLSNVIHEGTTERIIPIRMTSSEASAALNLVSEIIYIDCNDKDSISEKILNWSTLLSENGVIAGNRWEWPEVKLIVINASGDLNLSLSIDGHYWFLSKE